jgi:hypothetical protein
MCNDRFLHCGTCNGVVYILKTLHFHLVVVYSVLQVHACGIVRIGQSGAGRQLTSYMSVFFVPPLNI